MHDISSVEFQLLFVRLQLYTMPTAYGRERKWMLRSVNLSVCLSVSVCPMPL